MIACNANYSGARLGKAGGPTRAAVDPSIIPGGSPADRRPSSEPANENRDFWTPG
jgi:hypothetical protein